ncbi:hypothetical protein GOZ89_08815 [Agrobacterium vitis]|uniref:hypothetical protein n=1 Tax=Agrobacterium vitis TaxID=373 RepID=UPI0012E6F1D6|nr:hypothetical protein [Agrobacterium vitis]MVA79516.1 hypothetical protein [Agrobacterium vitis]
MVLLKTYSLPHGVCTHEDALTLLVLNGCCPDKCSEWQAYFIDSMACYILRKQPPENRIDRYKLQWLINTFTTDGKANSPIEQRLLQQISMMMADLQSESVQSPDVDGVNEKTVVSSVHPLKRQSRELRSRSTSRGPKEEKTLPLQQPKKRFALG